MCASSVISSSYNSIHALIVTVLESAADCPQALLFLTETLPVMLLQLHVIDGVPCPDVIVTPEGTVQVGVTPVTDGVVKVNPVWFGQVVDGPLMLKGVAGNRVSVVFLDALPPHAFVAVTDKVPEIKVEDTLSVMELPLLAITLHPLGTIQL